MSGFFGLFYMGEQGKAFSNMIKLNNIKLIVVLFILVVSTPAASHFDKSLLTPEHIKEAITCQKSADENQTVKPKSGETWFVTSL